MYSLTSFPVTLSGFINFPIPQFLIYKMGQEGHLGGSVA